MNELETITYNLVENIDEFILEGIYPYSKKIVNKISKDELKKLLKDANRYEKIINDLRKECELLSNALDMACNRLEKVYGTCPIEMFSDTLGNCEKCEDNLKACWRKYFLEKAVKK